MPKIIPFKRTASTEITAHKSRIRSDLVKGSIAMLSTVNIKLDPLVLMLAYIANLRPQPSNRNIAIRREGLKKFTPEELEEILNASYQSLWKRQPAYYRALADEIRFRKSLESNLPKAQI